MPTRIDHVIIAAPDLDHLEATFVALGFHVTGGGTHPHLGTRNRVIILGEGYIELLGVADAERVSPALRERIAAGGGWVGFALQSADIAAEAQAMRGRGVDARGPTAGRLVSPDGGQRSWRVVTIAEDDLWAAALPLPFLIQHDSAGERHQRELAGAGGLAPHANGATRLLGVSLRASDFRMAQSRFKRAFAWGGFSSPARSSSPSITFPLVGADEWIEVKPALPSQNGASVMSVTLGAPDLAAISARATAARLSVYSEPDLLSLTLPVAASAQLTFQRV